MSQVFLPPLFHFLHVPKINSKVFSPHADKNYKFRTNHYSLVQDSLFGSLPVASSGFMCHARPPAIDFMELAVMMSKRQGWSQIHRYCPDGNGKFLSIENGRFVS
jgi:hypothetical protein